MATNYIQEGENLVLSPSGGASAGAPVLVGGIPAVALVDIAPGQSGVCKRVGVFDLSVKGVNDAGNSAVAVGDRLYFNASDTPKITKKASGAFFGYALEAVGSGQTGTINVLLAGKSGPGDGEITAAMLANRVNLEALIAAGLGAAATYAKTTSGAQTLLAAYAEDARVALIVCVVTEAFADGDGGQTAFTVGETDSATKYAASTVFADASLGDVFVLAGTLTATKALLVTATAATGTGTGALSVNALVLPAAA